MGDHARLSPSSAHRWARCPGAPDMESNFRDTPSPYSTEGTVAHKLAERCLNLDRDAQAFEGTRIEADGQLIDIDAEMCTHVQTYLDDVRDRAKGGDVFVELTCDLTPVVEEKSHGTADLVIKKGSQLGVHDFKYGKGVRVHAKDNKQLMLYAAGVINELNLHDEISTIQLHIHQPRLNHHDVETLSMDQMRDFEADIKRAAHRTRTSDKLIPGDTQCRFCKAKGACPALMQEMQNEFEALPSSDIKLATAEQLASAFENTDLMISWANAVKGEIHRQLNMGYQIPGLRLKPGRMGPRTWSDLEAAMKSLKGMRLKGSDIFKQTLLSPTQIENLHKQGAIGPRQWNSLQPLINRSPGKPKVVPEDDNSPVYKPNPEFKPV